MMIAVTVEMDIVTVRSAKKAAKAVAEEAGDSDGVRDRAGALDDVPLLTVARGPPPAGGSPHQRGTRRARAGAEHLAVLDAPGERDSKMQVLSSVGHPATTRKANATHMCSCVHAHADMIAFGA